MTKKQQDPSLPTLFTAGMADLRVVDAGTGDVIERVLTADVTAGTVTRYAVEDDRLVIENDAFKVVEEERKIRIERIEPPKPEPAPEAEPSATDAEPAA